MDLKANPPMVECPQCDAGIAGYDEDGGYHPCYLCGMSGRIPADLAESIAQENIDAVEYRGLRPARRPLFDSEGEFIRFANILPPVSRPKPVLVSCFDDDIPF